MISLILATMLVLATPMPIATEEVPMIHTEIVEVAEAQKLAEADAEMVARLVWMEARGECYEGKKAVAQVVYNRASLWGMSISEVCEQKGQFADWHKGKIDEECYNATIDAFYDCDSLGNATHFSSNGVSWGKEQVAEIGGHKFYR